MLRADKNLPDDIKVVVAAEQNPEWEEFHAELTAAAYALALDEWYLNALTVDRVTTLDMQNETRKRIRDALVEDVNKLCDGAW